MKLNTQQLLFTGFFAATVMTVFNSTINWDKRIYAGAIAFIITIAGAALSKMFIKDKD